MYQETEEPIERYADKYLHLFRLAGFVEDAGSIEQFCRTLNNQCKDLALMMSLTQLKMDSISSVVQSLTEYFRIKDRLGYTIEKSQKAENCRFEEPTCPMEVDNVVSRNVDGNNRFPSSHVTSNAGSKKSKRKDDGVCFLCKKPGHLKRFCPLAGSSKAKTAGDGEKTVINKVGRSYLGVRSVTTESSDDNKTSSLVKREIVGDEMHISGMDIGKVYDPFFLSGEEQSDYDSVTRGRKLFMLNKM